MLFRREIDLVDALQDRLASRSQEAENEFFLSEFSGYNGIADLVHCRLRKDWRSQEGLSLIPPQWIAPLATLPARKWLTLSEVSSMTGYSISTSRSLVRSFIDAGYCETKDSKVRKLRQPRDIFTRVVAYEAKLTDWRKALLQARRYREYADYALVALSADYIIPALKNKLMFESRGVGLLAVEPNKLTPLIEAQYHPPRFPFRRWLLVGRALKLAIKTAPDKSF